MTKDTTPEAVERLAKRLDGPVRIAAQDLIDAYFGHSNKCLASIPADESKDADLICVTGIRQAAATLRALAAERDHANACNRGLVRLNEATQARADALKAEVARLRDELDSNARDYCLLMDRYDALQVEVARLRDALKPLLKLVA
jgi:uncharacterized coiled-coil DUF342 family protein